MHGRQGTALPQDLIHGNLGEGTHCSAVTPFHSWLKAVIPKPKRLSHVPISQPDPQSSLSLSSKDPPCQHPQPLTQAALSLFSAENMFLLQTIDQTSPLLLTFLLLYSQFKSLISYPLCEFLNSCSQIPLVIIY